MKALLKLLGFLLLGACFGLIVVVPLIALIEGDSMTSIGKTICDNLSLHELAGLAVTIITVLIAVALALDNDRAAAEEMYNKLKENRDKYIHQGDVTMSLDIMHWLLDKQLEVRS